jgi:hypothetical protein
MYNDADYLSRNPVHKWIHMYLFNINPNLVAVARNQLALTILLKKRVVDVSA